jgi:hypothetical protein
MTDLKKPPLTALPENVQKAFAAAAQREAEWIQKYGYVRPPITCEFRGQTAVAVGSRLFFHKWKTFHDFLFTYIGYVIEKEWFAAELKKPIENWHPLMQWYNAWFELHAKNKGTAPEGEIVKVDGPPAQVSALLSFAYDLYTLEHHGLLSQRLIERLKRNDLFQGARYETYVAATFVRAGFTITHEDETDPSTTHCEFAAVYRQTDIRHSVEAKSHHRAGFLGQAGAPAPLIDIEADLSGLLVPALRKHAKHDRIVFIDINVPPSESAILESGWFNKIASQLNRLEANPQDKELPPAIVFVTNFPYHFVEEDDPLHGQAAAFTGFKMPDFRPAGDGGTSIVAKFPAIMALNHSVLRHTNVPHDLA